MTGMGVRNKGLLLRSCTMGLLLLCGFQSPIAMSQAGQDVTDRHASPCLDSTCRDAPVRETVAAKDLHTKYFSTDYVRAMIGGFDQGAGIAGGAQLTTAKLIPHMEFRSNCADIDRKWITASTLKPWPTRAASGNHVDVWYSYLTRETDFFGIGPRISNGFLTGFSLDQRSYQGSFYRDFTTNVQGGVFAQVMNSSTTPHHDADEQSITDRYTGTPDQPNLEWLPGFLSTTQILSYGAYMEYDRRNDSVDLTRGFDIYARLASDDGMKNHAAFTDYGWNEGEFDVRGYAPLRTSRTSLASRVRGQFKNPKGGSQIPFYDLSFLGGRDTLRGYDEYRFRGNDVLIRLGRTASSRIQENGYPGRRCLCVYGFRPGVGRCPLPLSIRHSASTNASTEINWQSGIWVAAFVQAKSRSGRET